MPSMWPRFDRDDNQIMAGDLPDFIAFSAPSVEAVLRDHGHTSVDAMVGYTPAEWADQSQAIPPQYQTEWTPANCPWFSASEGLSMCQTLRRAITETPERLNDYTGMADDLLEHITEIERVLHRAAQRDAKFQLTLDT